MKKEKAGAHVELSRKEASALAVLPQSTKRLAGRLPGIPAAPGRNFEESRQVLQWEKALDGHFGSALPLVS